MKIMFVMAMYTFVIRYRLTISVVLTMMCDLASDDDEIDRVRSIHY